MGKNMIPLVFADVGKEVEIVKIGGNPDVKHHLENIGFIVGDKILVLSSLNGNLIVSVKGIRVAISMEMAQKIMVLV